MWMMIGCFCFTVTSILLSHPPTLSRLSVSKKGTSPGKFLLLAQVVDLLKEESRLTLFEEDELYLPFFLKYK